MSRNINELKAFHAVACAAVMKADRSLSPAEDRFWPLYLQAAFAASSAGPAALTFEQWASDPLRADKIPLEQHPNGAYKDSRSYLIAYGWKSALKHGVAAPLPREAATVALTDEQRDAIEWAAGRAHVEALGKPIAGVEGRRWRVLSDLFRAAAASGTRDQEEGS